MQPPPSYADLNIRLRGREAQGYPIDVAFEGRPAYPYGHLPADVTPWVPGIFPAEDGERLLASLLADERLKTDWAAARGRNPRRRIRLGIDASAPELHTIPWELLRDASPGRPAQTLAADEDTPFARYLAGRWEPERPPLERPIKLLVAIANPDGLAGYGLAPLDPAVEQAIVEQAVAGLDRKQLSVTALPSPVTLPALEAELRKGYHLLHLVAHGNFLQASGEALLYLADAHNQVALVKDVEFAEMLARQDEAPRLVFLASCQSATRSSADALRGLAPQLIAAGVPAVVAMQEQAPIETARRFTSTFYRQLLDHGQVDLASNQARSALLTARDEFGWGIPVLYSQLATGQLLAPRPQPRTLVERVRSWPAVAQALAIGGALLSLLSVIALLVGLAVDIPTLRQPGGPLYAIWPAPTPTPTPITPMPDGFTNIAVAQFAEIDATGQLTVTQASQELSEWLFVAIQDQLNQFPDLNAFYRGPQEIGPVTGVDQDERAANAEQKATEHNATILLYGLAQPTDGQYQAWPEFYVSRAGFGYGAEIAGADRLGAPVTFTLPLLDDPLEASQANQDLKARRQVLQYVVIGLAYYYLGQADRAYNAFDQALFVPGWPAGQGQEVIHMLKGAARLRTYGAKAPTDRRERALREANEAFATAYALEPGYARAHLGLAAVALAQAELICPQGQPCPEKDLSGLREKLEEAAAWYSASLAAPDQAPSSYVPVKADYGLGQVYLLGYWHNLWPADAAKDYFQRVVDAAQANPTPDLRWFAGNAQAYLGLLAGDAGDYRAMADQLYQGIATLEDMPAPANDWIALYWSWAALAEEKQSNIEQARSAYRQAIDHAERAGPKAAAFSPDDLATWRSRLAELE